MITQYDFDGVDYSLLADKYGTPLYLYSANAICTQWDAFNQSFGTRKHRICYAVKANSNLSILKLLADRGSGFDIVSGGELKAVLLAGGKADKTIFSGVAKQAWEIKFALTQNIGCFNVESLPEVERIALIAKNMGKVANIAVRINPDIDAGTHPYISTGLKENKFGVDLPSAYRIYDLAKTSPSLNIEGISCHVGSQLTDLEPFNESTEKLLNVVAELEKCDIKINHIDVGGGLGVRYDNEDPPAISSYVENLCRNIPEKYPIFLEPGRAIVANAGVLLTKVEYLKETPSKNFALVDGAMNDLLRPSLYSAYHNISRAGGELDVRKIYDIVGPVCETSDFLGKNRELGIVEGDLLCIFSVGGYGFVMGSNYNSRGRAAEVLIDKNGQHRLISSRESFDEIFSNQLRHLNH